MSAKRNVAPYELPYEFEAALVYALVSGPGWSRYGAHIEPGAFGNDSFQTLVRVAKMISDAGRQPSIALVLARMRTQLSAGRITKALYDFCFWFMRRPPTDNLDEVLDEFADPLRRRMQHKLMEQMFIEHGRGKPVSVFTQQIEQLESVGLPKATSKSLSLGSVQSLEEIEENNMVERISSGVLDIDEATKGGYAKGTVLLYIADTGGGKSIALVQQSAAALWQGHFCGYVTLELPRIEVMSRMMANLTGIPTNTYLENPRHGRVDELIRHWQKHNGFGHMEVHALDGDSATLNDVFQWVKEQEQEKGRKMTCLFIDYWDRLRAKVKLDKDNTYLEGKNVATTFFNWCRDTGRWGITASASKEKGKRKMILDNGDVADSVHKTRAVDYVETLNPNDANTETTIFFSKNRLGTARKRFGPFPTDYGCARLYPSLFDARSSLEDIRR